MHFLKMRASPTAYRMWHDHFETTIRLR